MSQISKHILAPVSDHMINANTQSHTDSVSQSTRVGMNTQFTENIVYLLLSGKCQNRMSCVDFPQNWETKRQNKTETKRSV